jgi:hypothetical protein
MIRALASLLRRFLRDDSGSVAVEAMLVLPMLVWCYVGTFVFFDAYRTQAKVTKASYTIGDTLSRETGYVTNAYMNSLHALEQWLVDQDEPVRLRVTVFRYDQPQDRYVVRWSQGRGGMAPITTAQLAAFRHVLPIMVDQEIGILTQAEVVYRPAYEVGLDDFTFREFTVTRPRFAGQLCWNSVENGGPATATC